MFKSKAKPEITTRERRATHPPVLRNGWSLNSSEVVLQEIIVCNRIRSDCEKATTGQTLAQASLPSHTAAVISVQTHTSISTKVEGHLVESESHRVRRDWSVTLYPRRVHLYGSTLHSLALYIESSKFCIESHFHNQSIAIHTALHRK